jgi:hypothetical protein
VYVRNDRHGHCKWASNDKQQKEEKYKTPVKGSIIPALGKCGIHSQRRHQEVVLAVTLIRYFMVCVKVKHKLVANAILTFRHMKSKLILLQGKALRSATIPPICG